MDIKNCTLLYGRILPKSLPQISPYRRGGDVSFTRAPYSELITRRAKRSTLESSSVLHTTENMMYECFAVTLKSRTTEPLNACGPACSLT